MLPLQYRWCKSVCQHPAYLCIFYLDCGWISNGIIFPIWCITFDQSPLVKSRALYRECSAILVTACIFREHYVRQSNDLVVSWVECKMFHNFIINKHDFFLNGVSMINSCVIFQLSVIY